jgi:hypothetical protein
MTMLGSSVRNPFPGLRPFREDEEHLFFGRENQVDTMIDILSRTRFLAVVGTSGSGKSSLVNAGLRPALHRGLMAKGGTSWWMVQFRPGGKPIQALAHYLASEATPFTGFRPQHLSLADIMEATLRMTSLGLLDIYEQAHLREGTNLLVVVDQFEELFRFRETGDLAGSPEQDRDQDAVAFVNLLLEATSKPDVPIYIVITMRSDFLGECARFSGLAEAINKSLYLIPRMSRDQRRGAIAGPVGVGGAEVTSVLLNRLVNDVGDNPDQLSILQHALNRTWGNWQLDGHGPLSFQHYEAIGTMAHALDKHAESAYAEFRDEREKRICEKIFKALTDRGTDTRGTRRPTTFATLCALAGGSNAEVSKVIDVFREPSRSFLMPPLPEVLEEATVVDISHESFMRVWERLKNWTDEEAESARLYRRLSETADLHAKGRAALWRDPDLQLGLDWVKREQPSAAWASLYKSEEVAFQRAFDFLENSRRAREDEKRREEHLRQTSLRRTRLAAIVSMGILGIITLIGVYLTYRWTLDQAVEYVSDVDHFKYGSTGSERVDGIPYWLWVALPELFPEYLPDKTPGRGYSSFGMIYEPEKDGHKTDPMYDLPVGMSMRIMRGIEVVYFNCAACHAGVVPDTLSATPRVVTGMPANTFDLGALERYLISIAKSNKFTAERLLDQIRAMEDAPHRPVGKLDLINRYIFRYYAVYYLRESLLMLGDRHSFIDLMTWGPGRVDTYNELKSLFNFPMDRADPKELVGGADFPSVWNQGPREGMQLDWDGNNTSLIERNLAFSGTSVYPYALDASRVLRTATWLLSAKPPAYPYPVSPALATRGEPIYQEYCAGCHGTKDPPFRTALPLQNERVGTVVPIADIGTDKWRLNSYTWVLAANQSTLYAGYEKDWGFKPIFPQRFTHFRKTQGYANSPLDGIWLRAPYLHNGSVPNLKELLEPASVRTKMFYRGNDVYDRENVGFVSNVAVQGGRRFFLFDTSKHGNGDFGHEGRAYGTNLSADEKKALIEYLKTF